VDVSADPDRAPDDDADGREDDAAWPFAEGDEIVPGLRAWGVVGEGLRCETWVAWDDRRWCPVAVKLPHPDRVDCERTLAGLGRESSITGRLAHPSVQRLLDDRLDRPLPHLVFEYVQGPAVIDLIEDDGRLNAADLGLLALQVASALRYLHEEGIVHLDVKPHNVVERRGHSVLIDFGFARPVGHIPPPGRPRGTPPYMAPEQCCREPAAASMDMFALGALLYEAATGTPAFDSEEDVFAQLDGRPPPVGELAADLPPAMAAVIDALLHPDPGGRPAWAGRCRRGRPACGPPSSTAPPRAAPRPASDLERAADAPVEAVAPLQELLVDEVAAQRGEIGVHLGQAPVHLRLGVDLPGLEQAGHVVEHHPALGVDGRDAGQPAVAHERPQDAVGVGPAAELGGGRGRPVERLERLSEPLDDQPVIAPLLFDQAAAGEPGQGLARPGHLHAGPGGHLGGRASAEDEGGHHPQPVGVGQKA
jgi:hypothetical protein